MRDSNFFYPVKVVALSIFVSLVIAKPLLTAAVPIKVGSTFAEPTRRVKYAIVIHGGAGSDPSKFSAKKNQQRKESLEKAIRSGLSILKKGGSSLDAVETTIRMMEDDPIFNAGKGAVFNAQGQFELDASIMDGRDKSCGAVAGVKIAKNPISLARLVRSKTRHVLLSGDGADQFAKEMKVMLVPNIYFQTPVSKARWQRQQKVNPAEDQLQAGIGKHQSYLGTVGCVALDNQGNLAAGTSTGGLSNKKFGRIGDSPIVGAGTYADNQTCGISCTGIGELFIRNAIAYDVSARMKYKNISIGQAAKEVIHTVLKKDEGGLIGMDQQGNIAIEFNTKGMSSAVADSTGRMDINWSNK